MKCAEFHKAGGVSSGDDLFDVVGSLHEESFVAIAGYLVYRITADRAPVQVAQDLEFFIEIQLLV